MYLDFDQVLLITTPNTSISRTIKFGKNCQKHIGNFRIHTYTHIHAHMQAKKKKTIEG